MVFHCLRDFKTKRSIPMSNDSIFLPAGTMNTKKEKSPKKPRAEVNLPTLAQVEKEYIVTVFKTCGENKMHTATVLGISLKSLYNKLHAYGLMET
jgi:DNA-binding NtrC family response regulator